MYIYIYYIYVAKASFSAYVLVNILLKNWGKSVLFDQKKHDQFWSSFLFLPFSLFCLKMAKISWFIILFVRNFWRVCSQFWLSVRNSV